MKKSFVFILVLALVSGFAFAEDGQFNVDIENTIKYSAPTSFNSSSYTSASVIDNFDFTATYLTEDYTVALNGGASINQNGANIHTLQVGAQYMFSYPQLDKLAAFGSVGIYNNNLVASRAGLDVEFSPAEGSVFRLAPQVWFANGTAEGIFVPVKMFAQDEKADVYAEAFVFTSASSFKPFAYAGAYAQLRDSGLIIGGYAFTNHDWKALVKFQKALPFAAKGVFSFEHPTTFSFSYSDTQVEYYEGRNEYKYNMVISGETEIFKAEVEQNLFGLSMRDISLNLIGRNYRRSTDGGNFSRFILNTEFAFDCPNGKDEVKLDFNLEGIHFKTSPAPQFSISLTYSPKSAFSLENGYGIVKMNTI